MGVDAIDHFPRGTETSTRSSASPQTLVDKGFAYESDGDVYFDVAKCRGLRQAQPPRRRGACRAKGAAWPSASGPAPTSPCGKSAKPGEPSWDSPWGPGRPGWHIECSAMSRATAGRDVRHPRRRARPGLPASRKRNRPERMLPRQADGQVLDAQRPDAGLRRGRQGRRTQHAARRRRSGRPGGRQDQQVEGRQRRSANCSSSSPARRSASSSSRPTIAGRSTSAKSGSARSSTGLEHVLPLLQAVRAGHRRELLRLCRADDASRGRFRPGRRCRCSTTWPSTAAVSSRRWTTTSTPAAAIGDAVRPGPTR